MESNISVMIQTQNVVDKTNCTQVQAYLNDIVNVMHTIKDLHSPATNRMYTPLKIHQQICKWSGKQDKNVIVSTDSKLIQSRLLDECYI